MKKWNTKANSIPIMRSIWFAAVSKHFFKAAADNESCLLVFAKIHQIFFDLLWIFFVNRCNPAMCATLEAKQQASRNVSSMVRGGNRKLRCSCRRWNNQVWQCQISRYPKQRFELDQLPVQRKILAALRLHQQKIWISRCIRWPHNKTCVFKKRMWVW